MVFKETLQNRSMKVYSMQLAFFCAGNHYTKLLQVLVNLFSYKYNSMDFMFGLAHESKHHFLGVYKSNFSLILSYLLMT